jgi:hypothetical protein
VRIDGGMFQATAGPHASFGPGEPVSLRFPVEATLAIQAEEAPADATAR